MSMSDPLLNRAELAKAFGVSLTTVDAWVRRGCPYVSRGSNGREWQFDPLAVAHWRLGNQDEARKWYDQAVAWMNKNQPKNEELRRFRAEAEELMKIERKKD